ncbi:hypothetical protein GOODEAATRI_027579, partial [Goodea atripinnis]
NNSDNPILQLVKAIATDGVTPKIYSQRAELLSAMFEKLQLRSGAHQINAQCNISTVIGKNNEKCIKRLLLETLFFTVLAATQRNNKGSTICFS